MRLILSHYLKIVIIAITLLLLSCNRNVYDIEEMVDRSEKLISKNGDQLLAAMDLLDDIIQDTCGTYLIHIAPTRSYFSLAKTTETGPLIGNREKTISIDEVYKDSLRSIFPRKTFYITSFVQDFYVCATTRSIRSKELIRTKVLYIEDKEKFKESHTDHYIFFDDQESLIGNAQKIDNWMYFLNDNWAVSLKAPPVLRVDSLCY